MFVASIGEKHQATKSCREGAKRHKARNAWMAQQQALIQRQAIAQQAIAQQAMIAHQQLVLQAPAADPFHGSWVAQG